MMIETTWNLGNFTVKLAAEVTDEIRDRLASYGLRFLGQRVTEVDKVLGGFETVNGKQVRIKGWKRNEAGFTHDRAMALRGCFEGLAFPDDPKDKVASFAAIEEYVRDVAEAKFTEERAIMLRHESAGDLEEWLAKKVGYEGPTHGDDGEYAIDALREVRELKRAAIAAANAGL